MSTFKRLDVIRGLLDRCDDAIAIRSVLSDICRYYGVDHAAFLHQACNGCQPSCVSTYPTVWCERYNLRSYIDIDPTIKLMTRGVLPADWDSLRRDCKDAQYFFDDALSFGVGGQGLSVPTWGPFGQRGLFSVASGLTLNEWQYLKLSINYELQILALHLHDRIFRFGGADPSLKTLSRRETECLELLGRGKIPKQIAATLKISDSAIRHYLKSAKHKLKATTTYQAIAIANALGLINVLE